MTNLIRSGNALLEMLNNLIDFSVIEGQRLQIKASPFDLFRSLDRCLNLIAIPAHHTNLSVYLFVDPRVPKRLVGDPLRVVQVLINLLNNGVKFTEHGTISLTVTWVNESENDVDLSFVVCDTGIGIKPEQLEEIFEFRAGGLVHSPPKLQQDRTGLSIARQIARRMDGDSRGE